MPVLINLSLTKCMVGAACLHYWVQKCRIDDVSSVTVHTIKKEMIENGFHVQIQNGVGRGGGGGGGTGGKSQT